MTLHSAFLTALYPHCPYKSIYLTYRGEIEACIKLVEDSQKVIDRNKTIISPMITTPCFAHQDTIPTMQAAS